MLRHGETEWNLAGRWQGALDSALTPRGEAQARALGAMMARLGIGPATHRLLSSPQGRAVRTAALAFGTAGEPDARLREIGMGAWSGRTLAEIARGTGYPPEPDLLSFHDAAPEGEGIEPLARRAADLLASLVGPTILVTHGIAGLALRGLALGLPLSELPSLPTGQGVAFRIREGVETVLAPAEADGAPA